MATRNIVPRATGEGQIGTSAKTWSAVYANDIAVTNGVTASTFTGDLTGDVTGTASNATSDALGNNIANTYLPAVVGAVVAFAGSTSPAGWLLCDGSAVSRTTYVALFNVIGTTYGAGDGSTTFNLPNLIDKFIEGSATVGTSKGAGLPNITGNINNSGFTGTSLFKADGVHTSKSGALYPTTFSGASLPSGSGTANDAHGLGFDASKSNSIYGNSNTVQPPAITMRYIIKY